MRELARVRACPRAPAWLRACMRATRVKLVARRFTVIKAVGQTAFSGYMLKKSVRVSDECLKGFERFLCA